MSQKPHTNVLEIFESNKLVKICAPMVRYSKLQFRNLVYRYNCDLVVTPMILADSFCQSNKARTNEFSTNLYDSPVIVQFAANKVHDFVGASYMVSPHCDGVDLNCGCPQRWAKEMNLGCEMLKNPQIIYNMIRECRNRICKPFTISVKTRIQKDLKRTVDICKNLEKCGVSFLTIHARTPDDNVGPICKKTLEIIVDSVQLPVVGNGGITTLNECYELQECSKVKGVMIANGILTNPKIFTGASRTSIDCVQDWLDICYNSTLSLESYEELCKVNKNIYGVIPERCPNLTFQCFHHHLVFMLEKILNRKERQIFNNLKTFKDVLEFLSLNFNIQPRLFPREKFLKSLLLNLNYNEDMYTSLRPKNVLNRYRNNDEYDPYSLDGTYFICKVDKDSCSDSDEH